jgi:hypothetical protein
MFMKTLLVLGFLIVATTASVSAQSFSTAVRPKQMPQKKAAPLPAREVTGVIPRAVRGGNPLQMLNPRAPARYGTAEQSVAYDLPPYEHKSTIHDPGYPGKWRGIKFFSFVF